MVTKTSLLIRFSLQIWYGVNIGEWFWDAFADFYASLEFIFVIFFLLKESYYVRTYQK